MKALQGVILFSAIETVVLAAWLILAGLPFDNPLSKGPIAVVVLAVGLVVEHYVSVNVGAGRPPFGPLPPDKD